jgi:ElaB/YqjD/DUF883 family membrane-anchored ribosome-binding protein
MKNINTESTKIDQASKAAIEKADYYAEVAKTASICNSDFGSSSVFIGIFSSGFRDFGIIISLCKSAVEDANEAAQAAKSAVEDANETTQFTDDADTDTAQIVITCAGNFI